MTFDQQYKDVNINDSPGDATLYEYILYCLFNIIEED